MDVRDSVSFFKALKKQAKGLDPEQFRQMVLRVLDDMPELTIAERVSVKRVMEALFAEEMEIKMRRMGEELAYNYFQGVKKKRMQQHMVQ